MKKETAKSYIKELLDYEEKYDMFFLTSRERGEFHQIVDDVFEDKEETVKRVLDIIEAVCRRNEVWSVGDGQFNEIEEIKEEVEALLE